MARLRADEEIACHFRTHAPLLDDCGYTHAPWPKRRGQASLGLAKSFEHVTKSVARIVGLKQTGQPEVVVAQGTRGQPDVEVADAREGLREVGSVQARGGCLELNLPKTTSLGQPLVGAV